MAARVEVEGSVLRVVDTSMGIAVPFLVASVIIGEVSSVLLWILVGVGSLATNRLPLRAVKDGPELVEHQVHEHTGH